jgi:acyl carrier protein
MEASAMSEKVNVFESLIAAINEVKRSGFTLDSVEPDFYLGGDLGIDSREMFEVWYELEERLGIKVEETDKRDRYTLQDVADVLRAMLGERALPA